MSFSLSLSPLASTYYIYVYVYSVCTPLYLSLLRSANYYICISLKAYVMCVWDTCVCVCVCDVDILANHGLVRARTNLARARVRATHASYKGMISRVQKSRTLWRPIARGRWLERARGRESRSTGEFLCNLRNDKTIPLMRERERVAAAAASSSSSLCRRPLRWEFSNFNEIDGFIAAIKRERAEREFDLVNWKISV